MDPERYERMLSLFKVLADDTRLRILGMVAERPCTVEELAVRLKLKEPTVSHHLSRLREAGLVAVERDKNARLYRLTPESLHGLSRELLSLEEVASPELAQSESLWEDKILANFVQDGRLNRIPASRKKREVILRWLLKQFQPSRRYSEREVNQVLNQYHEDVATLRRELVGYGWLQRENQVYWLTEQSA
ncbi:MAG: ArsR family transcriptional regulator [Candidatus Melainabacteria bacterium HGW-Melainabacteria-1]|nr:MAG: ArsR family transcriptional regulator [Candidatus Melainabacteria bacterium HGW-Melainabacteria-1]